MGSAVPQSVVLGEGDLPIRPYGEAAGLWDRGDMGMGSGWCPSLGCTSTCIKDGVIWVGDAAPELIAALSSPGTRSGCLSPITC